MVVVVTINDAELDKKGFVWFSRLDGQGYHGVMSEKRFDLFARPSTWPWRPMCMAKKDGTPYLLKFKDDLTFFDAEHWHGVRAVMLNHGSSWLFAAPVGCGGFMDDHFVGFMELPK